jgi:asparagine synthase (glutamine-hydrolysing)
LIFNGEIFNYRELRLELQADGVQFSSESDTEVLLQLYQREGRDCVKRLNGQWAFAVWDRCRQELVLSRDRVGIRPLHWCKRGNDFLFASEIKALRCHPDLHLQFCPDTMAETLAFWAPLPGNTPFREVFEVPAGHHLVLGRDRVPRIEAYWDWPFGQSECTADFDIEQKSAELLDLLRDAIRLQWRSDVPVATYLSGGLDSSLVSSLSQDIGGNTLHTFSLRFDDANYDESYYQNVMQKHIVSQHHELSCSYESIGDVWEKVVQQSERTLLRTAPAPLYLLAREVASQGFKVVLTGEGADEVFAGYDIFRETLLRRYAIGHPRGTGHRTALATLYPYLPQLKQQPEAFLQNFFSAKAENLEDPLFPLQTRMQLSDRLTGLLQKDFKEAATGRARQDRLIKQLHPNFTSWPLLDRAQYLEAKVLLPQYILGSQSDRMAMASSIEGRHPFLDHRLIEFASKIPSHWRILGVKEKWLLKKAAAKVLPREIIHRPKQPYRAPDLPSLLCARNHLGENLMDRLTPKSLRDTGVFDERSVDTLLRRLRSGGGVGAVRDQMALAAITSTQILAEYMKKV